MEPVVDVQDLSFTYRGAARPALAGINLQVQPGQFLTITGPSGCGKSTLALCLAGFIPHAYPGRMEGRVRIQGKDTRDYPAGGLSGIVGLVQQDPEAQLCTLRVQEEVAFGPENLCLPPEEIAKRVHWALEAVGALNLKERQIHTLSGGEKQRVAIASVLAMTPGLLILDEPTANLDPACTREVLQTLQQLKAEAGMAIIVIEHRLAGLAPLADAFLFMEGGKIVGQVRPGKYQKKYVSLAGGKDGKESREPLAGEKGKEPLLTVDNLRAGYGGREILQGISFSARGGETIALMGDNGSGKTTLLLALLGLLPAKGKIFLAGEEITGRKVTRRARDMGLTFQNPNHQIFEKTVAREAALPARFLTGEGPASIGERVDRLLAAFQLEEYRDVNPFTLSLGEKKRLTLVSVLAYSPQILLLDEPLVGQDSHRLELLLAALAQHRGRGGITLMSCHEPEVVASCCQRVLFLEKGRLLIDAPVEEALTRLAQLGREEYLPAAWRREVEEDGPS
ncbi:MAG: ATP-binding cassette domain-containing protein [bacterium]|jgi:energy-coupling factor transporter ATP-binding protein EcfA2|nr:ATP-binding cassette domain-containing protein [Bacillota bacterium]HHW54655.1 ATP-binding cassette domain-containing protein [Bacillota bacterium]